MHDHVDSWPFKEPVDVRDVPDYYDIIRDPMGKLINAISVFFKFNSFLLYKKIWKCLYFCNKFFDFIDLKTMTRRVESEQYYVTLEMFLADARRMFANARTYNSPETIYFKCSTRYSFLEDRGSYVIFTFISITTPFFN